MLETQVKDGKNVDTTALSKEVLPKMQEHLKKAEELAKNQNFNVNPAKPDSTKPEPSK